MNHVWIVTDEGPVQKTYASKEGAIARLREVKEWYEGFGREAELVIEEDEATLTLYNWGSGHAYVYAFKREIEEC